MTAALVEEELDVRLHAGVEFFDMLCRDIAAVGRGDRVALATMSLDPQEPPAARVLDALRAAAVRGVRVTIALDAYTMRYPRRVGPFVAPRILASAACRSRETALARLRQAGAACTIVNDGTGGLLGLYAGRSHLKIAVVADRAYLGGPSLHGCDGIDLAAVVADRGLAGRLDDLVTAIAATASTQAVLRGTDRTWTLDARTRLLLDAGAPGQSAILDEALAIIDAARRWITITCQYVPTGALADRLQAAHRRGVDLRIIFNEPSKHDQLAAVHRLILASQRLRRPARFFAHPLPGWLPKLHAKALASETTAMVGSHNLADAGVWLGTSEIAVVRHDPGFAGDVHTALRRQLAPPARAPLPAPVGHS